MPSAPSTGTPWDCSARVAQLPSSSIAGPGAFVSTRAEHGFTILEAVVALAIVGLAGVAALEAGGGGIRGVAGARAGYTAAPPGQAPVGGLSPPPPRDMYPPPAPPGA